MPIEVLTREAGTSSPMCPIATATIPARAMPTTARAARTCQNSGASPERAVKAQPTNSAIAITRARPTVSARLDIGSTAQARAPVERVTVRLASVAPTAKCRLIEGSRAWVA